MSIIPDMSKVTFSRTLLAPSEEQGRIWAARAWSLLAELGKAARPHLEEEFRARVELFFSEKPSFRREEFFNTGGCLVQVGHPSLPKPLGECSHGARTAWPCERDAHFRSEVGLLCKEHFEQRQKPQPVPTVAVIELPAPAYSRVYRPRKGRNAR